VKKLLALSCQLLATCIFYQRALPKGALFFDAKTLAAHLQYNFLLFIRQLKQTAMIMVGMCWTYMRSVYPSAKADGNDDHWVGMCIQSNEQRRIQDIVRQVL
jgi:hypothetical protein